MPPFPSGTNITILDSEQAAFDRYLQDLAKITGLRRREALAETHSQVLARLDAINKQVAELNRLIKQKGEQA